MRECNLWLAGEAMGELCREFGRARPGTKAVGIKKVQEYIWLVSLWIMIRGISIWRLECLNRSNIRSAQRCHHMTDTFYPPSLWIGP